MQGLGKGLGDVGDSLARDFSRYHALPPLKKSRFRAGAGAGLITLGGLALIEAPDLVFTNWVSALIWAGMVGFGVLWLCVGIKGARGPREAMSIFWTGFSVLTFAGLSLLGRHLLDAGGWSTFLESLFITGLVGSAVRLWLAARGMGSTGLEDVKSQQAHGRARDATPAEAAGKLNERDATRPQRQFRN